MHRIVTTNYDLILTSNNNDEIGLHWDLLFNYTVIKVYTVIKIFRSN